MRFISCGNRLEKDLIQQPSLKHVVMSCVTDDVSNVKDFESYEIGLRVCSEKQGTACPPMRKGLCMCDCTCECRMYFEMTASHARYRIACYALDKCDYL